MVHYFIGEVPAAGLHIANLPGVGVIRVQTDIPITIAFWNPAANAYGTAENIAAPGDEVSCVSNRVLITGSGAKVTVKP